MRASIMMIVAFWLGTGLSACSRTQKPVLYPNQKLKMVGKQTAERTIEDCMTMAGQHVSPSQDSTAMASATTGAAVGGAGGGAAGAVWRGRGGRGAAAGAAGGAAAGLTRGLVRDFSRSGKPSPLYKNFVNQCLRENGYVPIGWR